MEEFLERWDLTEEDIEEVKKKKIVHKRSWGGSHYLLYYDEERNEVDVYKLIDYSPLKK